jgi:hypothetical protein
MINAGSPENPSRYFCALTNKEPLIFYYNTMAVTIYEVAKKAGVGIGTVSRVLNNSAQISPQTRARFKSHQRAELSTARAGAGIGAQKITDAGGAGAVFYRPFLR